MADVPTATTTRRYQALDLWRGVICLFVVLEHAVVALWNGSFDGSRIRRLIIAPFEANIGTPLFFVISGYCIASSIESSRRRGGSALTFLARRFWRVFPPYWVAVLAFVVTVAGLDAARMPTVHSGPYTLALPSVGELSAGQWLGNLTLTETWRPRVGGGETNVFTRVAWSLCYQEQFYLICFAALVFRRMPALRFLGLASIAIVGLRVVAGDMGALHRIDGTFPVLWHQFAVGLAAYWYLNAGSSRKERHLVPVVLAVMAYLAARSGDVQTTASAVFGLVVIGMRRWDDGLARLRMAAPLRSLGRKSYSVYLIHLPVIVLVAGGLGELGVTGFWTRALVTVPLSTALAILAGVVFYRVIESRFIELPKPRRRPDRPRSFSAPMPMPIPLPA